MTLARVGTCAALLACACAHLLDPTPLSADEAYLEPYLDQLSAFRDNPIAKRFITLANLVDVVPTWLIDLFVPLLIPDSKLSLPMNVELPIPFKFGPINGIPPDVAHLEITYISIDELDHFKKLKPIKFLSDTRYTWGGHVIWDEGATPTLTLGAKLVLFRTFSVAVNITATIEGPGIDFGLIMAMDREKMCNVWGTVFQSSMGCAAHPLFVDAENGISGVKLSELTLHATDFSLDEITVDPLPFNLHKHLGFLVQALIADKKADILAHISDSVSEVARNAANLGLLMEIPLIHKYYPCSMESVAPVADVSEVCFTNSAAFVMKWGYANCPTHDVSLPSNGFPVMQSECRSVTNIWPDAQPGQIMRATTEAVLGMHEVIDPAIRYQPDSNRATFECSGTTLMYKCNLISLVPVDPADAAVASEICVMNHAGFVLHYNTKNVGTGEVVSESADFPIGQSKCLDLGGMGLKEGDKIQTTVHADGGKDMVMGRIIEYRPNNYKVTFECKGTTLDFDCDQLRSSPRPPSVRQTLV